MFTGKFFSWKRWLFWILLKLRQRKRKSHDENAMGSGQVGGYGRKSRNSVADMEAAQKLDPHPDVSAPVQLSIKLSECTSARLRKINQF